MSELLKKQNRKEQFGGQWSVERQRRKLNTVLHDNYMEQLVDFPTSVAEQPIFGRLRLRKSEVPEPTPVPNKLDRLRLRSRQKKGGSTPYTKF